MNYCIHLKKRKNKPYCNVIRKEITLSQCRECDNKEYKMQRIKNTIIYKKRIHQEIISPKSVKKMQNIRKKSSKLVKLERSRFSVFTDNKDKCMFCNATTNLSWHEVFAGRNRQNSMEDGFCLRMCLLCHEKKQDDVQFNEYWHKEAQLYYEKNIGSRKQFLARYRRNWLD